jgi:ketosteroid isomerase-like protein
MTTVPTTATLERETAERLSRGFHEVFRTFEAPDDLFTADVLFDLNMPVWRFQLQGPAAWAAQLRHLHRGGRLWVDILRTVPTASGFVTEHVEHEEHDGDDLSARRMWLCEVRDGRIAEVVGYCSGEWDGELRARHAAEAPMIRP